MQTVCHPADAFQDAERPCVAGTELALGSRLEGLRRAVQQPQLDPITHLELHIAMPCIIIPLGQLLGPQKTLANLCQDLIPGS